MKSGAHISKRLKRVKGGLLIFLGLTAAFCLPSFLAQASADNQQPAPVATAGQSVQPSQPMLEVTSTKAGWDSFSDFKNGILDVTMVMANTGPTDAINAQLLSSTMTQNVSLASPLPVNIGGIRAGAATTVNIKYLVPKGVSVFRINLSSGTDDAYGNYYSFPSNVTKGQALGEKIGISVGDNLGSLSDTDLNNAMADIASLGVKWIRLDMAWDLVQPTDASHFDWSRYDREVAAAAKYNLKVLPVLDFTPAWARQQSCQADYQCAPADPNNFANYAKAAVARYAPAGITTWEIWNEPNISAFWLPSPDAAAYTRLLQASYTAIKTVDPQAEVISGGLSPADNTTGHIAPRDFLTEMYQDGAKNYFDAVGYHPYSYPALPGTTLSWSGWSQMSDLNPSIRSIMDGFGDTDKQIWATEFGTPSGGESDVNETLQAQSYQAAIQQMSGMPWMGAMFLHTYKDFTNSASIESYFGMVRYDGTEKPAYYELKSELAQ